MKTISNKYAELALEFKTEITTNLQMNGITQIMNGVARISDETGKIEVSPVFEFLDQKIQKLILYQVTELFKLDKKSQEHIRQAKADINIDWWNFGIKLVIAVLLWLIFRAFFKMKEEMEMLSVISYVRNRRLFIKSFEDIQFFRSPDETDKQLWNRLPAGGLFRQYLYEEYELVKKILIKKMKHKSIKDIEKLLSAYYPVKSNKT